MADTSRGYDAWRAQKAAEQAEYEASRAPSDSREGLGLDARLAYAIRQYAQASAELDAVPSWDTFERDVVTIVRSALSLTSTTTDAGRRRVEGYVAQILGERPRFAATFIEGPHPDGAFRPWEQPATLLLGPSAPERTSEPDAAEGSAFDALLYLEEAANSNNAIDAAHVALAAATVHRALAKRTCPHGIPRKAGGPFCKECDVW